MNVSVALETTVQKTARVIQAAGLFDVPLAATSARTISVSLPIESLDWQVGLIVGPSGSGKSTVAKAAWPRDPKRVEWVEPGDGYVWPADRSVLDGFHADLSVKEVTGLLTSVGFSSPPAWVRPWRFLSTGERFRCEVARSAIARAPLVVIDEFTSVVDRVVARVGSAAVAKAVRKRPWKRLVCVTCHEDVAEWLDPDWALVMPDGAFRSGRQLRRPPIPLDVGPCDRALWGLFAPHHYLDGGLHPGSACYVARAGDGRPVGFVAVLSFPHPSHPGWREHRLVVLPDFQGVGIGNALSAFVASAYAGLRGKRYYSTTGNPAMIAHRSRSPAWRLTRAPGRNATGRSRSDRRKVNMEGSKARDRVTASYLYVGPAAPGLRARWGLQ